MPRQPRSNRRISTICGKPETRSYLEIFGITCKPKRPPSWPGRRSATHPSGSSSSKAQDARSLLGNHRQALPKPRTLRRTKLSYPHIMLRRRTSKRRIGAFPHALCGVHMLSRPNNVQAKLWRTMRSRRATRLLSKARSLVRSNSLPTKQAGRRRVCKTESHS